MANFKRFSRYYNGIVAKNRSNQNFIILRGPLGLSEDDGDILVTVTQELEKRPDLVSQKAYGTPEFWWVVYEFNNIRDPFFDLKAGMILRLPEINRLIEAIQALEQ